MNTSKQPAQRNFKGSQDRNCWGDAAENDSWVFVAGRGGGTPGSSREHTNDDVSNVFKGTVGTGPMSQTEICSSSRVSLGCDHLRNNRYDVCVPSSFKVSYCSLRSRFSFPSEQGLVTLLSRNDRDSVRDSRGSCKRFSSTFGSNVLLV